LARNHNLTRFHLKGKEQTYIDETYTRSIKTNLRDGVMTWAGDMKKTEPGSIETTRMVTEPGKLLGLRVVEARVVSGTVA
jgi:hypothetical protein